jgi:hypothetical protein
VYRNGIIETAAGGIADGAKIVTEDAEDQISKKVEQYLNVLRSLQVPPPFAVLLAGVRMHGRAIATRSSHSATQASQTEPDMFFPPAIIDDYGDFELSPRFEADL